jgi:DNA uptake protein ComE-like DNA-binding protein
VALLAVLWLTVALSFMAMATAHLVRTEVEAVSNQIESEREYFLARGGIDAAVYAIERNTTNPTASDGTQPSEFIPGKRWLGFDLGGGSTIVEVVPEEAKLNVNQATPEQLARFFSALGESPDESASLAAAIVDWRSPRSAGIPTPLDEYYAALPKPYNPRHALLSTVDELMPVRGMSQELLFGRAERNSAGKWKRWPPLSDLLTTQVTTASINPNYASVEVLQSLPGWSDSMAADVIAARKVAPFNNLQELITAVPSLIGSQAAAAPLVFTQGPVVTLTSTGVLPGSLVRRSVRALVVLDGHLPMGYRITGWWDDWPTPQDLPAIGNIGQAGNGRKL